MLFLKSLQPLSLPQVLQHVLNQGNPQGRICGNKDIQKLDQRQEPILLPLCSGNMPSEGWPDHLDQSKPSLLSVHHTVSIMALNTWKYPHDPTN